MEIPIELFITFIGTSIALALFGFMRNPQIPATVVFAGMFILFLTVTTDTLIIDYFSNGGTDTINHYDVVSSTGQVTVNSAGNFGVGERLSNTSSALHGDSIDCITVFIGRAGSPPLGTLIQVGVMDTSTNFIRVFGTMNVTQLINSSVQPYEFCLPLGDTYTFQDTETVGFKWNDGNGSNTLTTRVDANNPFDGNNTERVSTNNGVSWFNSAGQDIMMVMTLRGSSSAIVSADFEFTELPKTIFALLGAIFMLSGALMVFKGER